jgi:glucokinase
MNKPLVLGVDIGGTKVAAGLVDATGKVLKSARVPIIVTGTAEEAMACVHRAIQKVLQPNGGTIVKAIGVSSPGPLDPKMGLVLHAPNLPCWRDFPLRAEIESVYKAPTRLDNDANAAGLAEAVWGAGAGMSSVFYITIGTGIGTAIILNRHVYYGRTGAAAEGGHMTIAHRGEVRCGCGKPGCIEGLAAGPAIASRARQLIKSNPRSGGSIMEAASGNSDRITAEMVVRSAQAGDSVANEVLAEVQEYLAVWIGNMIDLLEPDVIVIGGGVGSQISERFEAIRERSAAWSINSRAREIPFLPATYGVDAGIAGSAALWLCGSGERRPSADASSL